MTYYKNKFKLTNLFRFAGSKSEQTEDQSAKDRKARKLIGEDQEANRLLSVDFYFKGGSNIFKIIQNSTKKAQSAIDLLNQLDPATKNLPRDQ